MNPPTESASSEAFPQLLFGRHQGYDLREQWMSKGLLALAQIADPNERARLFATPSASDRFGIGPGMVNALRYWLRATGLMVEQTRSEKARPIPTLTPLGVVLSQHDPYLERAGSLWLLHAQIACNLLLAPTFYWFFQGFVGTTPFTKEACLEALHTWAIKHAPSQHISPEALRKDLECLFRLYTHQPRHATPEQSLLASPFRRLRLLQCVSTGGNVSVGGSPTRRDPPHYRLCPPQSDDIPALVVLALILEQNDRVKQVSLTHLLYRQQQIGRTCCVKQRVLVESFQRLYTQTPGWSPRPTLVNQQQWVELPSVTVEQVLLRYYQQPS